MLRGMRLCAVACAFLVAASAVAAAASEEGEAEETRICPGCGAEIPASAVFCPECHSYLPDAKVGAEAEPAAADAAVSRTDEPARRFFSAKLMANYMGGEDANVVGCILNLGFRVSDLLVLGPGVGFQDYTKDYDNVDSVPIYISLQANLSRGKFSPLIYGRVGYNKARYKIIGYPFTGDEDPSGPLVGFGGGFDILSAAGFGFTVAAGVQFEYMREHWVLYFPYTGQFSPVYERGKAGSYFGIGGGVVF